VGHNGYTGSQGKSGHKTEYQRRNHCTNLQEETQETVLCQTFKIYKRILVNKITLEIKGKLAELYAFSKGRVTFYIAI
jgi:hypothetical protein